VHEKAGVAICSASRFLLTYFLTIPVRQTIYWTDRRQICMVGTTMPVDDQAEITFTIPPWTLPWQPIFVDFIHKLSSGDIQQMALAYGKKCN